MNKEVHDAIRKIAKDMKEIEDKTKNLRQDVDNLLLITGQLDEDVKP